MEILLYTAAAVTNAKLLMSHFNDLKQLGWGQSNLKQLLLKFSEELADVKGMLVDVSAVVLPAALVSCLPSHTTYIYTPEMKLLKEG